MSKLDEIGKLTSVSYDTETGEVSVIFKITQPEYRDFALRWAQQDASCFIIRGDQLLVSDEQGGMRSAGRRKKDADV